MQPKRNQFKFNKECEAFHVAVLGKSLKPRCQSLNRDELEAALPVETDKHQQLIESMQGRNQALVDT